MDELRSELNEFNNERSCSSRTIVNARLSSAVYKKRIRIKTMINVKY